MSFIVLLIYTCFFAYYLFYTFTNIMTCQPKTTFKIISLNTYGYDCKKIEIFNKITKLKCDIACLQETQIIPDTDSEWVFRRYGLHLYHNSQARAGAAIVLKQQAKQVRVVPDFLKGRLCHVVLESGTHILSLYTPPQRTTSHLNRLDFIRSLKNYLSTFKNENILLAGDFNYAELPIDRGSGTLLPGDILYKKAFAEIFEKHNLIDLFRELHPTKRSYTFYRNTLKSRLDRIYTNIKHTTTSIEHTPITFSDHHAVNAKLELKSRNPRGRGFWKLNNSLLNSEFAKKKFPDFWHNWQRRKNEFLDPTVWWEVGKKRIAHFFKDIGIIEKRERHKKVYELEVKIKDLYDDLESGINKVADIRKYESELRKLEQCENEGAKIRSGVCFMENESPNSNFFKIEKRNHPLIEQIKDDRGEVQTDQNKIMRVVYNFYKDLYKAENYDKLTARKYLNKIENRLNDEQQQSLEGFITNDEIYKELKNMKNGKSPGIDGFPKEFYLQFWDVLGDDLVETINNIFLSGSLCHSMKTAVISILFKKGDPEDIKNYRPVSLLTVDYKCITKVLKTRLSKVMDKLVNTDQGCGVPGRSINDQLYNIECVIEQAKRTGGALLACDLKKAFDRVSHDYLKDVLAEMNFGNNFLKWLNILYKGPESMVLVNGFLSEAFDVGRSVRQGCPLSALLFVLSQEPLACAIRSDPRIKGINIPNLERSVKNIQFADDTTHPISNNCIEIIFETYKDFGKASGSEVNEVKTEILLLGAFSILNIPVKYRKYIVEKTKLLGILWDKEGASTREFWEGILKKVVNVIAKWDGRDLSFKGKVTVINACILSKLWYGARIMKVSKLLSKKFETCIFKFLWSNKTELIKRNILIRDYTEGGIKIPDVFIKCRALFLEKFKELYKIQNETIRKPWVAYAIYRIGIEMRNELPLLGGNKFVHNISDKKNLWHDILKIIKESNISTKTEFWKKTGTKNIYWEILKGVTKERYEAKKKRPHLDWESIWNNIWKAKTTSNKEKELYYKFVHWAIPVRAKFRGIPNVNKKCLFCNRSVETVIHLFKDCPHIKPCYLECMRLCLEKGYPRPTFENLVAPVLNSTTTAEKVILIYTIYIKSIWEARGLARGGKHTCPKILFEIKIKNRLKP